MKALETGNSLIVDSKSEKNRVAFIDTIRFFEEALKDTVVVKKDFLQKIIDEWGRGRGEITLASFLLGLRPEHFLQTALEEIEKREGSY